MLVDDWLIKLPVFEALKLDWDRIKYRIRQADDIAFLLHEHPHITYVPGDYSKLIRGECCLCERGLIEIKKKY